MPTYADLLWPRPVVWRREESGRDSNVDRDNVVGQLVPSLSGMGVSEATRLEKEFVIGRHLEGERISFDDYVVGEENRGDRQRGMGRTK